MEIDGAGEKRGGSSPFSPASARKRKPRLFIKEMVLRNFKSYAGEQRIGPFHKVIFHFDLFCIRAEDPSYVGAWTNLILFERALV